MTVMGPELGADAGLMLVIPIPPDEVVVVAVGLAEPWMLNRLV
jgi:hypothetical protein